MINKQSSGHWIDRDILVSHGFALTYKKVLIFFCPTWHYHCYNICLLKTLTVTFKEGSSWWWSYCSWFTWVPITTNVVSSNHVQTRCDKVCKRLATSLQKKTETHIFAHYGAYCLYQGLFSVRDLHELIIQNDCMATRNELSTEIYD